MSFENYGLRKTWLYEFLKSPTSQDPSETSMVSGPKHCLTSKFITRAFFVSFSVQNT